MRCFLLWIAACALFLAQAANPVSVQLRNGTFVVEGWTPPAKAPVAGGWASMLAVYTGSGEVPPLLGEYAVANGRLTFRPKYPLAPGLRVRAVFKGAEIFFDIPKAQVVSSTQVSQIYPSASEIPENQLKFYIEFSAPMSQGQAWRHIRLLKSTGEPVELPFLEIDQEMWDAGTQRLTVLFDPGRIKRGVKPLEDIGPAIEAGHSYRLEIDGKWQDAAGAPLVGSFNKVFKVVEADRTPISIAEWRISKIKPGTREPLEIQFPESLDAALALRLIWVEGVPGKVSLSEQERKWQLVPDQPWADRAVLKVDTALEDLAGNKVGRAFDVDLDVFEKVSKRVEAKVVTVPLQIAR